MGEYVFLVLFHFQLERSIFTILNASWLSVCLSCPELEISIFSVLNASRLNVYFSCPQLERSIFFHSERVNWALASLIQNWTIIILPFWVWGNWAFASLAQNWKIVYFFHFECESTAFAPFVQNWKVVFFSFWLHFPFWAFAFLVQNWKVVFFHFECESTAFQIQIQFKNTLPPIKIKLKRKFVFAHTPCSAISKLISY